MTTKETLQIDSSTEDEELRSLLEALALTEAIRRTLVLPDDEREERHRSLITRLERLSEAMTSGDSD